MSTRHEPVLLGRVLEYLRNGPGLYLDATVGDGGHAEALLEAEPGSRLLAGDRDRRALGVAGERLARFGGRVTFAHATFRELPAAHRGVGAEPFAGALLDLGLSSPQIDDPERGMSFQAWGPLDLRMDRDRGEPLAARLLHAGEDEIATVLREHGDVGPARRMARAIVAAARAGALGTTAELARLIDRAFGSRPHPRNRAVVFQALRMWINEEAEDLEAVLEWLPGAVAPGARVVTLAYHSGEDRRIKQSLRGPSAPASRRLAQLAPLGAAQGPWEEITRKVVTPTESEIAANPRARSARLRSFRRRAS